MLDRHNYHLVEERLEQMVVVTVEHHDVDRRLAKGARRAQAAEAGPHDEDRGSCRGPGRGPPRLREAHRCGLGGGTGHVAHLVGGWAASYCFCSHWPH